MGRQKRFKKIKLPHFAGEIKDMILKKSVVILVSVIFIAVLLVLVKAFLYESGYFRLRVVETKGLFLDQKTAGSISNELLKSYRGRNVFTIKLNGISRSLEASYPEAREVLVKISLPDRLAVDLVFHKPIAVLGGAKNCMIDEEGFILPNVNNGLAKSLPVISGIDVSHEERRVKKSAFRNFKMATNLLAAVKSRRSLNRFNIDNVDASDGRNLIFYLNNGTEVRIGAENFNERLDALERTLKDPRLVIDDVKYIDLRFEDVVIGPK